MKDQNGNEIDLSDKKWGVKMDTPLTVGVDPDTGALMIAAPNFQFFGATIYFELSPQAAAQLSVTLKQIETWLGRPIEDLARPDSVQ